MKHLLNSLFITTNNIYLSLDGENVVASQERQELARYPLHTLQHIISFAYAGASPALMGECAKRGIVLSFCTPNGRFLARTIGKTNGNVLLRRKQYRTADDESESCIIAKNMIIGKLYNCEWVLKRALRDHPDRVDQEKIRGAIEILKEQINLSKQTTTLDSLRGFEGVGAAAYFSCFDQMILRNKDDFFFDERNRRPPLDNVNAMLSFGYTLLAHECAGALESVGLDSYVGFMHRDRPGRESLALDMMEELRPLMVDRMVLSVINNRVIAPGDFSKEEGGAIRFTDGGRRLFLKTWQERKQEMLVHPFLNEKIKWGLVPYVQALLLSRLLRGDLDGYPAFLWK